MFARRVLTLPAVVMSFIGLALCTHGALPSARADDTTIPSAPSAPPATTTHAAGLTAAPPPPDAVVPVAPAPVVAPAPAPMVVPAAPPPPSSVVPVVTPDARTVADAPPAPMPEPGSSSAPRDVGPTLNAVESTPAPKPKHEPMNGYAFGLKIGVARVGTGSVKNPTYVKGAAALPADQLSRYGLVDTAGCDPLDARCKTAARRGFHLSVPLQIGGSGVGFRLEPYLTLASAGNAYGAYAGPTFEFRVAPPLYLGFGFGVQAAWVKAEPWKYAGDLYGRIPLDVTYYVLDDLALVLEFGFGAGASAYFGEVKDIVNPATGGKIARKADVTFGFGKIWDLSVGLRFP